MVKAPVAMVVKPVEALAAVVVEPAEAPAAVAAVAEAPKKLNREDYRFVNQKGKTLIKQPGEINGINFALKDLEDCDVFLLDHTSQVLVDRCTNCRLFIGPVAGSFFIRTCVGCVVTVACRQFRTRDCTDSEFRLFCSTKSPIIETSTRLHFTWWNGAYPKLREHAAAAELLTATNFYNEIFDFNEKDATAVAPHWEVLAEGPRELQEVEVLGADGMPIGPCENPFVMPQNAASSVVTSVPEHEAKREVAVVADEEVEVSFDEDEESVPEEESFLEESVPEEESIEVPEFRRVSSDESFEDMHSPVSTPVLGPIGEVFSPVDDRVQPSLLYHSRDELRVFPLSSISPINSPTTSSLSPTSSPNSISPLSSPKKSFPAAQSLEQQLLMPLGQSLEQQLLNSPLRLSSPLENTSNPRRTAILARQQTDLKAQVKRIGRKILHLYGASKLRLESLEGQMIPDSVLLNFKELVKRDAGLPALVLDALNGTLRDLQTLMAPACTGRNLVPTPWTTYHRTTPIAEQMLASVEAQFQMRFEFSVELDDEALAGHVLTRDNYQLVPMCCDLNEIAFSVADDMLDLMLTNISGEFNAIDVARKGR
jgi:hypothetical protein